MDPAVNMQETYKQLRERFTWINYESDDGIKGLSRIEKQLTDWCIYYAVATTMASNFQIQNGRYISFSVEHLKELSDQAKQQFPNMTAVKRLLKKLIDVGVLTTNDYKNRRLRACRYCIRSYRSYDVSSIDDIRDALYELRNGGPLCAVIYVSTNYDECYQTASVYKYDPNKPVGDPDKPGTHALSIVSFVLENGPFFDCQDSHGILFGKKGFLKVDVTSIKELYSFRVVEVTPSIEELWR